MTVQIDTTFIGWRFHTVKHYGAQCHMCGRVFAAQETATYNPTTKQLRCHRCDNHHPADLKEVWLVERSEDDEETGEPVTKRTVVVLSTRDLAQGQARRSDLKLIERLETFAPGSKDVIETRRHHLKRLGLA